MKRFLAILLFPTVALAQIGGFEVGYMPNSPGADNATCATNVASDLSRCAFGFILPSSCTINEIDIYLSGVSGAPLAAETRLDIFDSTAAGIPNASVANDVLDSNPTSSAVNLFDDFSYAASAHTQYWAILKNTNATSTVNYVTVRRSAGGATPVFGGTGANKLWGFSDIESSDGGTTWGSQFVNQSAIYILCASGAKYGIPVHNTTVDTTNKIYSTREFGAQFTIPATDPTYNVSGIECAGYLTGTAPAGGARGRLYTGSSPSFLATTQTIAASAFVAAAYNVNKFYFAADQVLASGTVVTLTMGAVSGGDASNYYAGIKGNIFPTAGPESLGPFAGTYKQAYYDGSSWAYDASFWPQCALILNKAAPFTVSSGGLKGVNSTTGGAQ